MEFEQRLDSKNSGIRFAVLFVLLFIFAIVIRSIDISARPLHSDESVNFLFYQQILDKGYYPYSHENYHGPLFFYVTTAFIKLLGENELGLRFSSILFGSLLLLPLLMLRTLAGSRFVFISAFFIALSPSLIFHSRYAIHESLFILGTQLLAFSSYRWCKSKNPIDIYSISIAVAILTTTKETYIINGFCIFLAILSLGGFKQNLRFIYQQRTHFFLAFLLFILLLVGIYTAGFRWFEGIYEFSLGVQQWIGRSESDVGHFKPFLYYLSPVILGTEPYLPAIVFSLLAVFLAYLLTNTRQAVKTFLLNKEYLLIRYFTIWLLSIFFIYSFVKYKTPWLVINITFPAILLISACLAELWKINTRCQTLAKFLLSLILLWTTHNTLVFNYSKQTNIPILSESTPYGAGNPFSYVHTLPGTLELVADIKEYMQKNPEAKVLIGMDGYFPLPFYLKAFSSKCAYMKMEDLEKASQLYDILILDFRTVWQKENWNKKYYRLSDYAESITFFKEQNK